MGERYANKEVRDLTEDDWKTVWELKWGGPNTQTRILLSSLQLKGRVDYGDTNSCAVSYMNGTFRKAGLSYRIFEAEVGIKKYRIAVVKSLIRKPVFEE